MVTSSSLLTTSEILDMHSARPSLENLLYSSYSRDNVLSGDINSIEGLGADLTQTQDEITIEKKLHSNKLIYSFHTSILYWICQSGMN